MVRGTYSVYTKLLRSGPANLAWHPLLPRSTVSLAKDRRRIFRHADLVCSPSSNRYGHMHYLPAFWDEQYYGSGVVPN